MKRVKTSPSSITDEPRTKVTVDILIDAAQSLKSTIEITDRDLRQKLSEVIYEMFGKTGLLRFEINSISVNGQTQATIVCPASQVQRLRLLIFWVTSLKTYKARLKVAKIESLEQPV